MSRAWGLWTTIHISLAAACGRVSFDALDAQGTKDAPPPLGPFGPATMIAELADFNWDEEPSATEDLLELYFTRRVPPDPPVMFRATRPSCDG